MKQVLNDVQIRYNNLLRVVYTNGTHILHSTMELIENTIILWLKFEELRWIIQQQ